MSLLLEDYLVRIYQATLTQAIFELFLNGQLDLPFLEAMCVIVIIIIVWKELPMNPRDWIQCYGLPVVVQYGPFPQHVAIAIPKQDPYRPYHSQSLAEHYVDLDRVASVIIELARKIVEKAPPPPTDSTRRDHMIKLRRAIMKEATRLGFIKDLQDAKAKMRTFENAFLHKRGMSASKKANDVADTVEAQDLLKDGAVARGKKSAVSYAFRSYILDLRGLLTIHSVQTSS